MPARSTELSALWVGLAETDIAAAKRLMPDLVSAAAFHLQQAIEKLLKAALIRKGVEPVRIHDLNRLFVTLEGDLVWFESEDWLKDKTAWAVATRYGAAAELANPTHEDIAQALNSVERLLAEVKAKLA